MQEIWNELEQPDAAVPAAGWHARLAVEVRRAGGTSLLDVRHRGPLRVQKALYPEGEEIAHAIVVHPPGGIAGGDRLDLSLTVRENASLLATTPGATKWYRANGKTSAQNIAIDIARGATLEWLPQETIVYDGVEACNRIDVRLAEGARALGCEVTCFGRRLSGEQFMTGRFRQRLSISLEDECAWIDAFAISGHDPMFASTAGWRGCVVGATIWVAGFACDEDHAENLREPLRDAPGLWGLSVPHERVMVVRGLTPDTASALAVTRAWWTAVRPVAFERKPVHPRIWAT
jgi:urease accessory protein